MMLEQGHKHKSKMRPFILTGWLICFCCLFSAPANADPVTLIVTAIAYAAEYITLTQAIIMVGMSVLSVGLGFLERALSSKPKQQQDAIQGINGTMQVGGIVPRSFIAGEYCTAGSLVYVGTWGEVDKTPNAFLTMVIQLSDLPVHSLEGIYCNDVLGTYNTSLSHITQGYAIPEFNVADANHPGTNVDHLWVDFFDGTQTTACSWLNSLFGGDANYPYGTDRIGYGIAYVVVTARVNPKVFSGFPRFKFIVKGIPLYDQREDSTADGSGSQTFDDQSTWTYSNNPVVMMNNILRGITWNGTWQWGLQNMSRYRVPSDSWFAGMNECDSPITQPDGVSTAPQYQFGAEIAYDMQPADILQQLTTCCNTRLAECGGIYKVHTGAAGSSILSFTDADIIIDQPQVHRPNLQQSQIINGLTSQFPDPTQGWAQSDAPPRYESTLETVDGQRLVKAVNFPLVPMLEQVQRLQKSVILEARKWRTHTFVLPPETWVLEPNDVASYTSARYSYTDKLFRVDAINDLDNCCQQVTLVECDPADYNWDHSTDYTAKVDGSLAVISSGPAPQSLGGFTVSAVQVDGAGGRKIPAIHVTWDTDVYDVDAVQWEVRKDSSTGAVATSSQTFNFIDGAKDLTEGIQGQTDYVVRLRYWSQSRRDFNWTDWLSVTTDALQITTNDLADALLTYGKFANSIVPVQQVDDLGSAVADDGAYAVLTTDRQLYQYSTTTSTWTKVVSVVNLDGEIDTSLIADAAVTTAKINDAAVEAAKIAASAVTTPAIAANAITASKMFIGSTDNLVLDPQFQDASYWAFPYGGDITTSSSPVNVLSSPKVIETPDLSTLSSGDAGYAATPLFTIQEYASYRLSGKCYTLTGFTGKLTLILQYLDQAGTFLAQDTMNLCDFTGTACPSNQVNSNNFVFESRQYSAYGRVLLYWTASSTLSNTGRGYFAAPSVTRASDGSLVVDGAITTNKLNALAVTADKLAANSVTATKLFIGSTDNLILDGQVKDQGYWSAAGDAGSLTMNGYDSFTTSAGSVKVFGTGTGNGGIAGQYFAVLPGKAYWCSCAIWTRTAPGSGTSLYIQWYDANGSYLSNVAAAHVNGGSTQRMSGAVTAPANACYGQFLIWYIGLTVGQDYWLGEPVVRKMADGELVVDGAISADKLAANSVTAGKVAANAITAGTLAVGAVNAGTIIVDNIIVTGHLVANTTVDDLNSAVSGTSGALNTGAASFTYDTYCSVSPNQVNSNSPIIITLNGTIHGTGSGTYASVTFTVRVKRNGSTIILGTSNEIGTVSGYGLYSQDNIDIAGGAAPQVTPGTSLSFGAKFIDPEAPSGTVTYTVEVGAYSYGVTSYDGSGDPLTYGDTGGRITVDASITCISFKR